MGNKHKVSSLPWLVGSFLLQPVLKSLSQPALLPFVRHWPLESRLKVFSDKSSPLSCIYFLFFYYHIPIFPSHRVNNNFFFLSSLPISEFQPGSIHPWIGQEILTLINQEVVNGGLSDQGLSAYNIQSYRLLGEGTLQLSHIPEEDAWDQGNFRLWYSSRHSFLNHFCRFLLRPMPVDEVSTSCLFLSFCKFTFCLHAQS